MKLTSAHIDQLRALAQSLTRGNSEADDLAAMGFAVAGEGRYGTWARITDAGRQYLDRMSGNRGSRAALSRDPGDTGCSDSIPVGAPGPAEAGTLLRDAATRVRTNAATNARGARAATKPPAAAQDVGAPFMAGVKSATRKADENLNNGMRKPHPRTAAHTPSRISRGTKRR